MSRQLTPTQMDHLQLQTGKLKPFLDRIKEDNTLDLQFRAHETNPSLLNIYYRGGSLLNIQVAANGAYSASFDKKYSKTELELPARKISNAEDSQAWVNAFPKLKETMDIFFTTKQKAEREFQQLVCRENNYSPVSNATDYFIVDIEYAHKKARFDLIGFHWASEGSARKLKKLDANMPKLALFEMKYYLGAISGKAGLSKHVDDLEKFLGDSECLENIKKETIEVFEQKRQLGLVQFGTGGNNNKIEQLAAKPEVIIIIANYDPASEALAKELENVKPMNNADLKFATSNFMGYGLYNEAIFTLEEFKARFSSQYSVLRY